MIPGQFGPITLVLFWDFNTCFTLIISCCGIPSVITTTKSSSAYTASRIASAAPGGGTYITEAVHPVYFFAYRQFLKTGNPK